jgi:hypothetical protein
MWNACVDTLLSLESIIFNIDLVLTQIKLDLKAFNIHVFVKFEVDLSKLKRILKDILHAFIKYMDEAEHLFHVLNKLFSKLKECLNRLVFFELTVPAELGELIQYVKDMFTEIQTALFDKMQLFERLLIKFPKLYQVVFRMPHIGGWVMKLKIFIGFIQCFCYFPVIFSIPWPPNILAFMELLEFDFLVIFGDFSCYMQLGFLEKFIYHMLIFPVVLLLLLIVVFIARCKQWRLKYTHASINVQALTLGSLSAFTLYTGVVSRVFRLFKCFKIEDVWYLTSDYNIKCWEGEWNGYAVAAGFCMVIYVFGLPAGQCYILYKYRHNLHKHTCKDPKIQRRVEKEFGSIYSDYKEETFYFEVVDLLRRLMLSGGLILMGSESVGQIFLAIIICAIWLCLLIYLRPYKSNWDNIVAITLAAHLLLTIISGMAFKLYSLMPGQDAYERNGFGAVLIVVSVMCICLSLGTTLASTPCFQKRVEKFTEGRRRSRSRNSRSNSLNNISNPMHAGKSIEMVKKKSEKKKVEIPIKERLEKIFNTIDNDKRGEISIDAFKTFLKVSKCDSNENMKIVGEWNGNIVLLDEFIYLCKVMKIRIVDLQRYEKEKRMNVAMKRLRRLSVLRRQQYHDA